MKCCVGIDLGSTTTKAVVLDEEGGLLGRGITNSRSNYDVACEIARGEAMIDARVRLLERRLAQCAEVGGHTQAFVATLRKSFRLQQHRQQLGELEAACRAFGSEAAERNAGIGLEAALEELFRGLRSQAAAAHAKGEVQRSDFFRDVAGSRYMALAREISKSSGVDHELLLGLYDKSILLVESHVPTAALQELLARAGEHALAGYGGSQALQRELARAVRAAIDTPLVEAVSVGTGYGRARLPFPKELIRSEILCHGLGAHAAFPGTRTVLDIGGQDTKAIQIDAQGVVEGFQMNDRCAAGCGRYLGYIADEMNVGLHELGPMAMSACRPVRINSTCTVFAGAELRDRLAMGQRREDILAGLHRAIMLRAMSLLARSGGIREEFTFTGGVAKNPAAVSALRDLVEETYGERTMNISPDSIYTGAMGAALYALRELHSHQLVAAASALGGAA